jgi:peptidoglycan/xylan/chitin deacetylase (PgdA/CDA1 family)
LRSRDDIPDDSPRSVAGRVLTWSFERGLIDRIARSRSGFLTVLCYHRVVQPQPDRFQGFRANISASPDDFRKQIDYLLRHYTPVSVHDVRAWLLGERELPLRPALVTFDDGYTDNGEIAWPILRARGVPAVVFLVTDHIENQRPFLWDYVAYCFHSTRDTECCLPLLGQARCQLAAEREEAARMWMHLVKAYPDAQKWRHAQELACALHVEPPKNAFAGMYLSWADVVRLAADGLDFGGHTRTHPVLTRVPLQQAETEICGSRERVAKALGRPPVAFAYPNGTTADFGPEHERLTRKAGYTMAFALHSRPSLLSEAARRPAAIDRIYIGLEDNLPRFAAKLVGATALRNRIRQVPASLRKR